MRPRILIIGVVIIAVLGIGAVIASLASNKKDNPGSTTQGLPDYRRSGDRYMKALDNGDPQLAYTMLSEDMKSANPLDTFTQSVIYYAENKQGSARFVKLGTVNNTTGYKNGTQLRLLTYKAKVSNHDWQMTLLMLKNGSEWVVEQSTSSML